jgi:hypothetical protein
MIPNEPRCFQLKIIYTFGIEATNHSFEKKRNIKQEYDLNSYISIHIIVSYSTQP